MKLNNYYQVALCVCTLIFLSACSRTAQIPPSNIATLPVQQTLQNASPLSNDRAVEIIKFVDSASYSQLSETDKTKAATAQFNALQFGRPGAPRKWVGSNGNKGEIIVGPFIRLDGQDCRTFEHSVSTSLATNKFSSTACRTNVGEWFTFMTG